MSDSFLISIVIPAYNEEENVGPIHSALKEVFSNELPDCRYEIIFVNDGSTDTTASKVKEISDTDKHVRLISLSRNFGHQAALTAGLERASGDAIITMDGDLQHPPSLIPEMIKQWLAGNSVVYGRRRGQQTGLFKRGSSHFYYKLLNRASEVHMPEQVSDFRLISREIQKHLLLLGEHARYLRGLVAWLGFKHTFIDYDQPGRERGKASYTLSKMLRLGMDGLLGFSMLPLRFGIRRGHYGCFVGNSFLRLYCLSTFCGRHILSAL